MDGCADGGEDGGGYLEAGWGKVIGEWGDNIGEYKGNHWICNFNVEF